MDDEISTVKTVTHVEVSWDDNPDNPYTWSRGKKLYHTSICASYAFTITFISSIYASGYKEVSSKYNVGSSVSLLGVSLYCLGLAFGPCIGSPLSESVGRLLIYRFSLPITMLFVIGSAVSKSLAGIFICRFFAAFFGSPALSIGSGTTADIWLPRYRGRATVFFVTCPMLGPALGPIIGGFVQESKGFRWLEWVCVFLCILTYIWALRMEETYKPMILRKLQKSEKSSDPGILTPTSSASDIWSASRHWLLTSLGRPLAMQFTEPVVFFLSLYVALNFGILYNFFPAVPWSLMRTYGFNEGQSGLAFLAIAIGCLIAMLTSFLIDVRVQRKQDHLDKSPASNYLEQSLWPAMYGSIGGPVALFWFAWTARSDVHWASPVCALIPFAWCNLSVFISAISYLVNIYGPTYGASSTAANAFARYVFAAAFPLFAVQIHAGSSSDSNKIVAVEGGVILYEGLGTAKATSILGACSAAMVPIPWILYYYGPRIRARSRRAVSLQL